MSTVTITRIPARDLPKLVRPDNVTSHSDMILVDVGNVAVVGKHSPPTAHERPNLPMRPVSGLDGRPGSLVGDVLAPQVGTVDAARCEIALYGPLVLFILIADNQYQNSLSRSHAERGRRSEPCWTEWVGYRREIAGDTQLSLTGAGWLTETRDSELGSSTGKELTRFLAAQFNIHIGIRPLPLRSVHVVDVTDCSNADD